MSQIDLILLVLLGVCFVLMALARSGAKRARARVDALEQMTRELRSGSARRAELEQDRRLVRLFLRELPLFMRELNGKKRVREIPSVMIDFVSRIFEPRGAVVLLRRTPARSNPEKEHQVIAAAAAGAALRPGTVLRPGCGILDRVLEAGRTFDRREFEKSQLEGDEEGDEQTDFRADLASPMWMDGEILGVIALSQPKENRGEAKYLLELIAQAGALALSNARAFNQIRSAADLDALTGILNKGAMSFLLEQAAERAAKDHSTLSIFLFDIDSFKNYNDVNGHLAGDELLRLLPRLVAENVRSDDVFGRYGGEEFLLILPERAPDEALLVAEKIRSLIEEQDFPFGKSQPLGAITVSGGVASLPDHAQDAEGLLRAADEALYRAKQIGRNRVLCAEDSRPKTFDGVSSVLPARDERDDLKQIRGIGPTFERALNDLGIFTYQQVADLNWQRMLMVATQLKTYPERIVRDGWMKQARELHADKYGRELPDQASAL